MPETEGLITGRIFLYEIWGAYNWDFTVYYGYSRRILHHTNRLMLTRESFSLAQMMVNLAQYYFQLDCLFHRYQL